MLLNNSRFALLDNYLNARLTRNTIKNFRSDFNKNATVPVAFFAESLVGTLYLQKRILMS
jgi:hypothetical protein